MDEERIRSPLSLSFIPIIHSFPSQTGAFKLAIRIGLLPSILEMNVPLPATLYNISGIISKNGRNDAKQLNVSVVTVSNDAKPKMLKKQRKAELSRRTVCKSLPVKE